MKHLSLPLKNVKVSGFPLSTRLQRSLQEEQDSERLGCLTICTQSGLLVGCFSSQDILLVGRHLFPARLLIGSLVGGEGDPQHVEGELHILMRNAHGWLDAEYLRRELNMGDVYLYKPYRIGTSKVSIIF